MSMHHIIGNLLDTNCQYICHQVNCQGKMNSGVAKIIRDKWPEVYTQYLKKYIDDDLMNDIDKKMYLDKEKIKQENMG